MGNFVKDLKVGEIGEKVVREYLERLGYKVENVTNIKEYQNKDIDFIVKKEGFKTELPIEIKTDTLAHKTGNLAYEFYSNKYIKSKGCFEKTQAKYIFYYLSKTNTLYKIAVKELRQYVRRKFAGKKMIAMGDSANGFLIKIKDLETEKIAIKIF